VTLSLVVRRVIKAPPEKVYAAWASASSLQQWWGPEGVTCPEAELDVRAGGRYRIKNAMPDGSVLWISGEFERVSPPDELVFSWSVGDAAPERVTIRFERRGDTDTEVIVIHDKIGSTALRDGHSAGWEGCLAGLAEFIG